MALVKADSKQKKYDWNIRESTNVRNKLPSLTKTPTIDYDKLNWLCNIDGLKARDKAHSSEDAHKLFMQNYRKMFVPQPAKIGLPVHMERRIGNFTGSSNSFSHKATSTTEVTHKPRNKAYTVDEFTYNIKDYLPLVHKERKSEDPQAIRAENIRTLRRLLKKYPFERTAGENDKIFSILQTFEFFRENVDLGVLKELCVVAQLETWKDIDFSVYGKTGVHMILRGAVTPLFGPYLLSGKDNVYPPAFVSLEDIVETDVPILTVGDCFGTWLQYEQLYTKELSVLTADSNCEFLKISATDYKRVKEQIKQREHTEKLNLLLSCEQYRMWPKQPLLSVADCIEWISYPPNTVLVSEGYQSPFIGFIKSGECHVLRQVDVMHTHKNGKKDQRTKQVVMGKLGPFDSFAEISLLMDEPVTCSIVSATDVELGVVRPQQLETTSRETITAYTSVADANRNKQSRLKFGSMWKRKTIKKPCHHRGSLSHLRKTDRNESTSQPPSMKQPRQKCQTYKNLDEVTRQLFRQSNTRTFGDLTKEDIQNEYLQQELKREWNEFKHAQVLEVINSQGIRPGYGKWAK